MSNAYTKKIIPLIVKAIEQGDYTLREIAEAYNVSISYVVMVKNNYDKFYLKSGDKDGLQRNAEI